MAPVEVIDVAKGGTMFALRKGVAHDARKIHED
jgi:hypothetical protein